MTAFTKKNKWDFHISHKSDTSAKFELCRLLGGLAKDCDAAIQMPDRRQTQPGEYSDNSGPAGLVPGPEFSNLNG